MRALSGVQEKAMDEETKIDLISAILAAGSVNMPDASRPPGSDHDGLDVVQAFRSISKAAHRRRSRSRHPVQVAGAEYGSTFPHRGRAVGLAPADQLEHDQDCNRAEQYGSRIQREHSHFPIARPPLATVRSIYRAPAKRKGGLSRPKSCGEHLGCNLAHAPHLKWDAPARFRWAQQNKTGRGEGCPVRGAAMWVTTAATPPVSAPAAGSREHGAPDRSFVRAVGAKIGARNRSINRECRLVIELVARPALRPQRTPAQPARAADQLDP